MYLVLFRSVLPISLLLIGCASQQQTSSKNILDLAIKEYFKSDYSSKLNSNKELTLAWVTDNSAGVPVLKYTIWNTSKEVLVYSGSAIRGKVDWLDNSTIVVDDYPGIINDESPLYRYKINVLTKVKSALNESNSF
jgi:hypothetical protein